MRFKWNEENIEYLKQNYSKFSAKEIAIYLKTTVGSVTAKASKEKLVGREAKIRNKGILKIWSEDTISYLKENYLKLELREILQYLNMSKKQVYWKASKLKLSRVSIISTKNKICKSEDCIIKVYCKNYCKSHYASFKRNRKLEKYQEKEKAYYLEHKEEKKEYSKEYRKTHPENRDKEKRAHWIKLWTLNNRGKINFYSAKRHAAKLERTPIWADLVGISLFYKNCPKGYDVDHIISLRGKTVSGLHVLSNLRYIKSLKNRKKSNKLLDRYIHQIYPYEEWPRE